MPLNIKNEATHRAAKKLAALRGVTLTKAVDEAIQEAIVRSVPNDNTEDAAILRDIAEIQRRVAALPDVSGLTVQEYMDDMYDDQGLPK